MIGVNHLGHFLLTNQLLDLLKKSESARIVVVSSHAHKRVSGINFDDFMSEQSYSIIKVYAHSKLANILFTLEMSKRLKGTNVTVNALHPGAVMTEFGRYLEDYLQLPDILNKALRWIISMVFRDARQGAQTIICLAVDRNLHSVSGEYFAECEIYKATPAARNETQAEMLWDISEKLVNLSS